MFRRFLLPSDGSAAAEAAIPAAMDLVHRTHATLDIVMVRERVVPDVTPAPRAEGDDDERAGSYLAAVSSRILASDGIRPRFALLKGDPAQTIHSYVHVHDIDLVALGTRGLGWRKVDTSPATGVGHVTEKLAASIDVPMLMVPPRSKIRPIDHVCIAVDGSPHAAAALAAAGVLLFQSAHATLLCVPPSVAGRAPFSLETTAIETDLNRLVDEVRPAWRSIAAVDLRSGPPSEQILGALGEGDCGMLVLSAGLGAGPGSTDGLQALTRDILERIDLPALVFPARASGPGPFADIPVDDRPARHSN